MSKLLNVLGLMTRAEHERQIEVIEDVLAETQAAERRLTIGRDDWKKAAADWEAKFKTAVTDLEGEVRERKQAQYDLALARLDIESLRPDALAMRRKRQMDRDRRKGRG